ncbi:uncharacterized protein LOC106086800 [Stomoxys calcitrans]|uniref:uncharacterized protein LOC106086800 n=1 Tax=Stomoxys calcitrans TaxID=35570 RepID=UPI0027E2C9C1|nr:uncharacterized protein LOC106086800 [Stomoxys calcitrans]
MNSNAAANVPGGIGYILDIIVVRLDIADKDVKTMVDQDFSSLVVEAKFNKEELCLTSSRINVVEFKAGRSLEFVENPHALRSDLDKNKLILKIKFQGSDMGMCALDWPEGFLNRLIDPARKGEMTHVFESEFKNYQTDVKYGTIEVLVRLQTKCPEWNDKDDGFGPQEDLAQLANRVIDPNDILFVVGEDKHACCCSQVGIIPSSETDKALHPTCLDLSNFRDVNGRTVPNTDVLNALDPACAELKNVTNQYQKLIDTLMCPQKPTPCCKNFEQQEEFVAHAHNNRCTSRTRESIRVPSCSSSDTNNPTSSRQCCSDDEDGTFAADNIINLCHKDSPPNFTEQVPVQPRCCPLCKENLSWLPKLAACPKCGYKPMPTFEERPYNDKLTANDILKDYLEKKSSCTEQPSSQSLCNDENEKPRCRCTCMPNKICAYCRIRKLCADVFQPEPQKQSSDCGKCHENASETFNICRTSSKDCRPHLTRVFSELKELYDIRTPKKKTFEPDPRCEKALNRKKVAHTSSQKAVEKPNKEKSFHTRQSKKQGEETEAKQFLAKYSKTPKKACKNKKFYNYNVPRKYPGNQVGHKTCINGYAGRKNVPHNMGWLWSAEATGVRAGWKPGAIRKPIKELMKYFLKDFPADTLRVSKYAYGRRGGNCTDIPEEELVQKPTLHICKKNGEYLITLRPLKDAEALRDCADPYLNMQPIEFRVVKSPLAQEMRKLKKCLKEMGFQKCTCHKPVIYCFCRSFLDKKRLEYQYNKEARKRNLPPCAESLVLSDTTDSETEFDFGVTPPAGVIKPENLKKPNLVNTGTQYSENDWNVPPLYPKPPNKYMKLYNCAIGERYGKVFGPYGPGGYAAGALPSGGIYEGCGRGGGRGGVGKSGAVGGRGGIDGIGRSGGVGANAGFARGMGGKIAGGRTHGMAGVGRANKGKSVVGGGTVDMMKYLNKSKGQKLSPTEMAQKRKNRLRELSGVAPPLICMVDRRAKPIDTCGRPCASVACCGDACLHDNRVC